MSFTVELLNNRSENNKVGKTFVSLGTVSCVLKDETSIIDPVFVISTQQQYPILCNYIHVAEFGRYYFVNDVVSIRNNVWELHCHVDVLESFKDGIRNQAAIVSRQADKWNLYLNDGQFKIQQNSVILTRSFTRGFNNYPDAFILAVAGGGGN